MNTFSFWQKWLFIFSLLLVLAGIIMAFFSASSLFSILNQQVDPIFRGLESTNNGFKEYQRFVYGVLGATMAGWGIFLAFISYYPFKKKEEWSRYCIITGLISWFLIDTSISIYYKVYINAAVNLFILLFTMLPVAITKKYFDK
jgi:Mn2+/Fe2+ NRAMP family transporter